MRKESLKHTHEKLHAWYARHGRKDLPWRHTDDPYAIWVSEVMLQQTQVKTVLERYYFPFLERFPTLRSLAKAPLEELLKVWEGLGYYTRARNLHRAARIASPRLPRTYEALLALPGIGPNTATAILAFAYKKPVAVMEANVRRILCRVFTIAHPTQKRLHELAETMLDTRNPFDYNQAMMDIGALRCKPDNPECLDCPFRTICGAHRSGRFDYPRRRAKNVPLKRGVFVIPWREGSVGMHRRTGRFLHGLWGFQTHETPPENAINIGTVRQSYTHFRLENRLCLTPAPASLRCYTLAEIKQLPLSGVDKKIVEILQKKGYLS